MTHYLLWHYSLWHYSLWHSLLWHYLSWNYVQAVFENCGHIRCPVPTRHYADPGSAAQQYAQSGFAPQRDFAASPPQLAPCACSARAWRLWAAQHSQG